MKFDKFTLKTQEALATAQQTAMAKSNTVLSPLHLLSAIISDDEGIGPEILKKIGVNVSRIKDMTESELRRLAQGKVSGQIMPDPVFNQIVLDAQNRADKMGDEYLSVEHLLMSLASVASDAMEVLRLNSVSAGQIEKAVKEIRGGEKVTDRVLRENTRRLSDMELICSIWRGRASSTRLSAETKKSGDVCRS